MARRNKNKVLRKLRQDYDYVGKPNHGIIKVVKDNKYGYADEQGALLIPPMYDWGSSFVRIELYGKRYVGAYVTLGKQQTIISPENRNIICPLASNTLYYIINGKLWVKTEHGYNLLNRRGRKLLSTDYESIVVDRLQQYKNLFLVKKNGYYGGIYISYNNREKIVIPFVFGQIDFWWAPLMGTLLDCEQNGLRGLYSLKGDLLVPCKYSWFECNLHFRKSFIVARNDKEAALYDGKRPLPICTDPYYVNTRYAFYYHNNCHFSAFTTTKEFLLDKDANVLVHLDKEKHISYFHFLMNQQRDDFRFKSLGELIKYCKADPRKRIGRKELAVYAYFFLEEEIHRYAMLYDLRYTYFGFCDGLEQRGESWGHCDYNRRIISLNVELLFTSEDFVRQVILHELCHLKYPNHGPRFYKLLNEIYGKNVRNECGHGMSQWLKTVDVVGAVRERMKELYELAEQGMLQRIPEGGFVSEVRMSQLPKVNIPVSTHDAVVAMKVRKGQKYIGKQTCEYYEE